MILAAVFLLTGCDDAADDCDTLRMNLNAAIEAFNPSTSNTCSTATDCVFEPLLVSRDGDYCTGGCPILLAAEYRAEFRDFLDTDADVTSACKAVVDARCRPPLTTCPCYTRPGETTCTVPGCNEGVCQ